MGFLAPLYALGLLAIALPIVFHLIRRTPQGRQLFSSLMFLTPSPPRLTRRSRLSNILLLLLRATVLALLAVAFCRPFFQARADEASSGAYGRQVAILLDTSASMRRDGCWQQAVERVGQVLDELSPADDVALYAFDRQVRPAFTFEQWRSLSQGTRPAAFRARLKELEPSWAPTRLGDAVSTVADLLAESDKTDNAAKPAHTARQLVLVSDLQQGAHSEALQSHQWPAGVLLDVRPVLPRGKTNASFQLAQDESEDAAQKDTGRLRVRITNQPGGEAEQFTLTWSGAGGPLPNASPIKVYVPAGQSKVVRVAWPTDAAPASHTATTPTDGATGAPAASVKPLPVADRLVLTGDNDPFDNTLYLVPPRTDHLRVLFVGEETPDDLKGLLYYLQQAVGDTRLRQVEWVLRSPSDTLDAATLQDVRVAFLAAPVPEASVKPLTTLAESGGTLLQVMKSADAAPTAAALLGVPSLTASEAASSDFALLSRVDLAHPLFASFADARFNDFTKIHFWRHRSIKLPEEKSTSGLHTLAQFDDGSPFLIERTSGRGRVLVATSGWQPADSQLALSSKFVPLLGELVRRRDGSEVAAQQLVYEPIALPATTGTSSAVLQTPDGRQVDLPPGASAAPAELSSQPGVYRLSVGGTPPTPVAVNVPADESRTASIDVTELERLGAVLGKAQTPEAQREQLRQLKVAELENRQKVWRWLIVAALAFVAAETFVAGRLVRRASAEVAPSSPGV